MHPQELTELVDFEFPTETQDDETGESVTTWASDSDMAGVWVQVLTGPGKEPTTAGAKFGELAARVNLRYDDAPGLSTNWRMVWNGVNYDIVSAILDAKNRYIWQLDCVGEIREGG